MTAPLALLEQSVAAFVLHALWQVPLLAGATALAIRVGRPQARLAHALWAATLLLCVVMPLAATVTARHAALADERAATAISYGEADYAGALPALHRKSAWQRMVDQHFGRDGMRPFAFTLSAQTARCVSAAYLLLCLLLASRLLVGWTRARRLVQASAPLSITSAMRAALQRQCQRLGLREPPARISDQVRGPALAGAWHPTLLLPPCAEQMTATETEAVLAHELAHLRRNDPPMHLACSLLTIPVGFHPAALWVAKRVRQTREMACDAEAAAQMASVVDYAHALLQVAERTGAGDAHAVGMGLFGSMGLFNSGLGLFANGLELTGGAMEERMQMMMSKTTSQTKAGRAARWSTCVAVCGAALVAATMVQVRPVAAQAAVHDEEPRLIGGAHTEQQLQKAKRQIDEAQSKATTDDERRKLATARNVIGAAQQQIAAASGHATGEFTIHVQDRGPFQIRVPEISEVHVDPMIDRKTFSIRVDPQIHVEVQKLMESAEVQRGLAEAKRLNHDEMQRVIVDARRQQEQAMVMLKSGAFQKQMEAAQRQIEASQHNIARLEMPDFPGAARFSAPEAGEPLKVAANVLASNSLNKVTPKYPAEAKEKKIQGEVLLHVLVDESGKVESLNVISSPDADLSKSAVEAVQQWTYKPVLLNGKPVVAESTVTVHYSLAP